MVQNLANWMQSTWLNELALGYAWTWPTLETLHFIGLCGLIGAILIMDLRLIGFQKTIPMSAVHRLMPVALAGFVINLVTGILFCFGDPHRYFINISFQLKMLFVVLAGLNFLLYFLKVEPSLAKLGPQDPMPPLAKAIGAASILFWFAVLSFGRLIPYLGTG
jgi:Family of unknown function (DUF6644)